MSGTPVNAPSINFIKTLSQEKKDAFMTKGQFSIILFQSTTKPTMYFQSPILTHNVYCFDTVIL